MLQRVQANNVQLINEQGIDDSTKKRRGGDEQHKSRKTELCENEYSFVRFLETLIKLNPLSYNSKHGSSISTIKFADKGEKILIYIGEYPQMTTCMIQALVRIKGQTNFSQ